jgi:hypothetical protein
MQVLMEDVSSLSLYFANFRVAKILWFSVDDRMGISQTGEEQRLQTMKSKHR